MILGFLFCRSLQGLYDILVPYNETILWAIWHLNSFYIYLSVVSNGHWLEGGSLYGFRMLYEVETTTKDN